MKKILFIIIPLALYACLEIEQVSEIPFLKYSDYELNTIDSLGKSFFSLTLTAGFEDGDGDIGYPGTDTTAKKTLFLNVYSIEKKQRVDSTMDIGFFTPYLERPNTNRTAIGEIEVTHNLISLTGKYQENDTIEAELYMTDRAMNKSNVIKSPFIPLNLD